MNDHYKTLDETVAAIRADCNAQLQAMRDKLLAAEIEATLARDLLAKATALKDDAIGVASRLIAHFDVAEKCFAEGKRFALEFKPAETTALPLNQLNTGEQQ